MPVRQKLQLARDKNDEPKLSVLFLLNQKPAKEESYIPNIMKSILSFELEPLDRTDLKQASIDLEVYEGQESRSLVSVETNGLTRTGLSAHLNPTEAKQIIPALQGKPTNLRLCVAMTTLKKETVCLYIPLEEILHLDEAEYAPLISTMPEIES